MGNSAARRQKAAELKARRIREAKRRKAIQIGAVAVAGVVVVGFVAYAGYREFDRRTIAGLQEWDGLPRNHVPDPPEYEMSPPAGGEHNQMWQDCGVYTEPIADMHAVHSLEHGAVWVTYDPDLPEDDVRALEQLYTPGDYVLVSPYAGEMPTPVVLSGWGRQVAVDGVDDERVAKFLDLYERANDVPEPGAACTEGWQFTAVEMAAEGVDPGVELGDYAPEEDAGDAEDAEDEDTDDTEDEDAGDDEEADADGEE